MAVITLQADSTTLVLNGRAFSSFAEGDTLTLAPVNPLTGHVNSTDDGVTIHERSDRGVHDLTVRVQRFSDDDVFLNSVVNSQTGPVILAGSVKENFVKDGTDGVETYELVNGSVTTQPTKTKNTTDGNALMEYVIRFRNVVRAV